MEDFRDQVRKGFKSCKEDIDMVSNENQALKSKILFLEQENKNLKEDMSKTKDEMLELKSELKGLTIAMNYIKEFNGAQSETSKVQRLESSKDERVESTPKPQNTITPQTKSQDPYEALLAFKAKKNKRDVLKKKMVSMVGENGLSLSELKFMFVDHFKYCSKATFYNYLKELEIEKNVKVERQSTGNYVKLIHNF
jgi:hypothetical protein